MANYEYDLPVKIITIGDSSVGKTSIIKRYANGIDPTVNPHKPTIPIDVCWKVITIGGKKILLQIVDTAGQERFDSLTASYYSGTPGVFIVYDVSRKETFDSLSPRIKKLKNRGHIRDNPMMLIGTKADIGKEGRAVTYEEGKKFSTEHTLDFFEVSAVTGKNIEKIFTEMAKKLSTHLTNGPDYSAIATATISFGKQEPEEKSECCS